MNLRICISGGVPWPRGEAVAKLNELQAADLWGASSGRVVERLIWMAASCPGSPDGNPSEPWSEPLGTQPPCSPVSGRVTGLPAASNTHVSIGAAVSVPYFLR